MVRVNTSMIRKYLTEEVVGAGNCGEVKYLWEEGYYSTIEKSLMKKIVPLLKPLVDIGIY